MSKCFVCGMVILVSCFYAVADAAEATKNAPAAVQDVSTVASSGLADIVLPSKESPEYWIIRSYTVNKLVAFLTKQRAEMRKKLAYFKSYLEQTGKTQDMLASDVQGANDPALRSKALGILDQLEGKDIAPPKKPLSWEELVDIGMRFVVSEGYSPIDMNGQELEDFKTILGRNEQFCMKIRKETLGLVDKAVNGWLYLESIDKQKEFRLYVIDQEQQKEQAEEAKRSALREIRTQQRLTEQQNVWQQKQDVRQAAYDNARERTREDQRRISDQYSQYGGY